MFTYTCRSQFKELLFKKTQDNPSKYLYRYYVGTIQTQYQMRTALELSFCLSSLPYSISKPVAAMVIAIFNFSSHSSLVSYKGRSMRLKQVLEAGEKEVIISVNQPEKKHDANKP